tara:strand:- start:460 stop:918 length:459 start_codon:yes stop_codon:yes gene_type:complete
MAKKMRRRTGKESKVCKFMKNNWHIITITTLLLAIVIIVIVFTTRPSTNEMFTDDDGSPTMVMFHVPWCGYCKKTMPIWRQLQELDLKNANNTKVKIIDVNCEEDKEMAKKYNIDGFPTIKYFPNGINDSNSAIVYSDERDISSLKKFLINQ